MVESLEVDDKDTWESIDRQTFVDIDSFLASAAFESGANHFLALHEFIETVLYLNASSISDCSPGNLNR